jgi:hypothetical protein
MKVFFPEYRTSNSNHIHMLILQETMLTDEYQVESSQRLSNHLVSDCLYGKIYIILSRVTDARTIHIAVPTSQ